VLADMDGRPERRLQGSAIMGDLNKVMLIGRLGNKPELRKLGNGDAVCNLRVATSYGTQQDGKFERETLWHQVAVFGKQAESCAEHLEKGRLVYVEGALRPDDWKDKDGVIHHGREVRASQVYFLGAKPGEVQAIAA
jgi:single-strand DNA-binding protein